LRLHLPSFFFKRISDLPIRVWHLELFLIPWSTGTNTPNLEGANTLQSVPRRMHQRSRSAILPNFDRRRVVVERFPDARPSPHRPLLQEVFLDILHLSHLVLGQDLHFFRLISLGCFDPLFFELLHVFLDLFELLVSLVSLFRTAIFEHDLNLSHLLKLDLRTFLNYSF